MKRIAIAVLAALAVAPTAYAATDCDVGIYSRYVTGIGTVAGKNHESAIQGYCRVTAANDFYGEGWVSQSTQRPGFDETTTNEFDATGGLDKKINDTWSFDVHGAYYNIVNGKRLLQGPNGDLANAGGTLRYQLTADTRLYTNLEGYHGLGNDGLAGGWRAGFGIRTSVGPLVVDGILYHNHNFLGHGQFAKVMIEPKSPIAKFAGGEIRPTVFIYQPFGDYGETHSRQIVGAVHITF